MDIQQQKPTSQQLKKQSFIEQESPVLRRDLFEEFVGMQEHIEVGPQESFMFSSKKYKPSKRNIIKNRDFRKILNSSSSNQRLIPHEMKYESSRQNSEVDKQVFENQNSLDSESFRKSFKKRYQQSFSVQNTIRDSNSSFSQHSQKSYASMLPAVYKQEQEMEQQKKMGCNCKRSKCLKLYCECFQKQLFCTQNCNCHSCGNHSENVTQHKQAIIEALARNAHGFDVQQVQKSQNIVQPGFSLGFQIQQVKKGCKCRKTHCLKKYCECYQNGQSCGPFCKCQDCLNTKQLNSAKPTKQKQFQVHKQV